AQLTLAVRNTSADLRFNPLPQSFLLPDGFTVLEFGSRRVFGGRWTWHRRGGKRPPAEGAAFDGILNPGEAMTAVLTTLPRDAPAVRNLTDHRGPLLWRLEVRRGVVAVHGKPVSATTVVGVAFDAGLLLHDRRELAAASWTILLRQGFGDPFVH